MSFVIVFLCVLLSVTHQTSQDIFGNGIVEISNELSLPTNVAPADNGSSPRRKSESTGRQLADITEAEASAGNQMKNGQLQRDEEMELKVFNGKTTRTTLAAATLEKIAAMPLAFEDHKDTNTEPPIQHLQTEHAKDEHLEYVYRDKTQSAITEDKTIEPVANVREHQKGEVKEKIEENSGDEKSAAWHGRQRDAVIRFNPTPPREKYVVPTMKLVEGPFVFRFLSGFFCFLHPFNFPTELLRDVLWSAVSVPQLILQSIRVEAGFIVVIILALMASLVLPAYGMCVSILMLMGKKKTRFDASSPTPGLMDDEDFSANCERRIIMLLMQMLLLISILSVGVMVIGNEFANNGAAVTANGLRAAGRDLSAYLQSTHRDLVHVLLDSADQTIAATDHDLDRVDVLLGEPIQKAIAVETGIDVALDALVDIVAVSTEISTKVAALGAEGTRASGLVVAARERIKELRRQLEVARDNCPKVDRPLCDTIDTNGLNLAIRLEMISEQRLGPLVTALNAKNLSEAAEYGKRQFKEIPANVANQTKNIIDDVREALTEKRTEMVKAERTLGKLVRHLASKVTTTLRKINELIRTFDAVEFWRWLLFLVIIITIILILVLLILAICCGCCGGETYGGGFLKSSVIMMCILSVPLWCLAVIVFAFGGHGEVFLCRTLYDEPEFKVLGKLLDDPSLLYKEKNGFFNDLFNDLHEVEIDQSVKNILRDCKEDRAAYPVFRLNNIVDLNAETSYFNWTKLVTAKERLKNKTFALNFATPTLQVALTEIMSRTDINFTDYRIQLNGPITGKDLTSLADQLESIANQNSDLSTSSRIETLASRTRRVLINNIQPLEQIRTELVYKLTELELQVQPFQRQMNQSLSHLKTIQYYIDNQGAIIAEKKTQDYVRRLTKYLEQYRSHVLNQVENHVGQCGPVWDIFNSGRSLICRHYIDSLNGYWLGIFVILLMWIAIAPLALKLRRCYKVVIDRKSGLLSRTISHQNTSENAMISEQSAWSTPGEPPPDNWR